VSIFNTLWALLNALISIAHHVFIGGLIYWTVKFVFFALHVQNDVYLTVVALIVFCTYYVPQVIINTVLHGRTANEQDN